MIVIGELKQVPVLEGFGKNAKRVLDGQGKPVTKSVPSEVWRVTRKALDGHFCRDRGRRLVIGLINGDVLVMRPEGRTKRTAEVAIGLSEVYSFILRSRAAIRALEKARNRKAAIQARRERRALRAAERRLTAAAKEGR